MLPISTPNEIDWYCVADTAKIRSDTSETLPNTLNKVTKYLVSVFGAHFLDYDSLVGVTICFAQVYRDPNKWVLLWILKMKKGSVPPTEQATKKGRISHLICLGHIKPLIEERKFVQITKTFQEMIMDWNPKLKEAFGDAVDLFLPGIYPYDATALNKRFRRVQTPPYLELSTPISPSSSTSFRTSNWDAESPPGTPDQLQTPVEFQGNVPGPAYASPLLDFPLLHATNWTTQTSCSPGAPASSRAPTSLPSGIFSSSGAILAPLRICKDHPIHDIPTSSSHSQSTNLNAQYQGRKRRLQSLEGPNAPPVTARGKKETNRRVPLDEVEYIKCIEDYSKFGIEILNIDQLHNWETNPISEVPVIAVNLSLSSEVCWLKESTRRLRSLFGVTVFLDRDQIYSAADIGVAKLKVPNPYGLLLPSVFRSLIQSKEDGKVRSSSVRWPRNRNDQKIPHREVQMTTGVKSSFPTSTTSPFRTYRQGLSQATPDSRRLKSDDVAIKGLLFNVEPVPELGEDTRNDGFDHVYDTLTSVPQDLAPAADKNRSTWTQSLVTSGIHPAVSLALETLPDELLPAVEKGKGRIISSSTSILNKLASPVSHTLAVLSKETLIAMTYHALAEEGSSSSDDDDVTEETINRTVERLGDTSGLKNHPRFCCASPCTVHVISSHYGLPVADYLIAGSPKIWFVIPRKAKAALRKAMKDYGLRCFTPHDTLFIHPRFLLDHHLSFKVVYQQPGSLVLTDDTALYEWWNPGSSLSETVHLFHQKTLNKVHRRRDSYRKHGTINSPCRCARNAKRSTTRRDVTVTFFDTDPATISRSVYDAARRLAEADTDDVLLSRIRNHVYSH
ncbi:hypothetical protein FRC20_002318 [Serendipita sp. 405]|nr:hypothetical protein FRC20_002318 [Serendipita sp. 405]